MVVPAFDSLKVVVLMELVTMASGNVAVMLAPGATPAALEAGEVLETLGAWDSRGALSLRVKVLPAVR